MGILRAPCALALMALVGLAGCQTGKSWLSSNKSAPSRDAAAMAKSDYPVPPSKMAGPPSLNPSAGRMAGMSPATSTPGIGSTSGGTVSGSKYGASMANYNTPANPTAGTTPGSSLGSRTGLAPGSAPGAAIATDPFPTGPQRGRFSPLPGSTPADTRTLTAGSTYPSGGATYPNTGYGSTTGLPAGRSGGVLPDRLSTGTTGTGSTPSYGSGLSGGSAPSYGAVPSYGSGLSGGSAPSYGAVPSYGSGLSGGATPSYGAAAGSGSAPSYGTTPSMATRPNYAAGTAASGSSAAGADAGSSLYQPLRSRAADPLYAGGASGGSSSSGSRDYVPGATGYNPGSTGYSPPTGNYVPGNTGYNPQGIPQDRPSTSGGYYQSAPASSGDDLPPYRPGGTSDVLRRPGTTSPVAGTSSSDPLGTATRRSDFDVAPVGYDSQPDTTLRR